MSVTILSNAVVCEALAPKLGLVVTPGSYGGLELHVARICLSLGGFNVEYPMPRLGTRPLSGGLANRLCFWKA